MKNVYTLVFNGLADWEIGLITYELNTVHRMPVRTVGWNLNPIKTGGGMKVMPEFTLSEVDPQEMDLLILPGGEMWHRLEDANLAELIHQVYKLGGIVAGICAASLYLVKIGMFNSGIKHTSNGLDYLKYYLPDYGLQDYYLDTFAVSDQNIITARGEAPFEFAYYILKALDVYDDEILKQFASVWRCQLW